MKTDLYNLQGEKTGTIELPEKIFNIKINEDVIYQVVNVQITNSRQNLAHTKNRSDVKGGGKKPWRQKGTGRARHGSIRSPLWRGGGITFGPRNEEDFSKKINKKIKQKALFMVLTSKVRDKELIVVDNLMISEPKTKLISKILSNIFNKKQDSILITIPQKNENIAIASRNINNVKTILADSLNVLDLLSFRYLLLDKESIKVIEKTYGNI
ncbi:MAG TPA: 50S ribosomal protein L4 [Candidatus Portnoybacteria bacterium]|jgi:large subunit ribosomal protein L4|nr:50S ribosomal protein L4 [Candidatus Portnoybacteria bacterium]MDD5751951.1 50S ribosomal protein L4 [Candidatus Portnoybacteria bacterium]HNU96711.1 50S ribosomal protein L4 [Candidatus Portnoybacteria bacterium]HOZ16245.1 50S ribosomal protein L4 [Candidatus Portnoybacteria bacterium]HPH51959.1 50S ribosomal protein L4 [Candidatus Portnoybacteria bacterium]